MNKQANCRQRFRKLQFLKGRRIENLMPLFITTMVIFTFITYIPVCSGQTFALEEVVGAPADTWRLLYVPKVDALFVGTYHGTVHRFDGENWELVLDTRRDGYSFLNYDSYGNIYVSVYGRLYKSNDNGKTWSIVFEYSKEKLQIWHIADLGNGSLLGDNWVSNYPYLWRSDSWGETWYLWKNFTELFSQYAKPSSQNQDLYQLRHLHRVAYDNYTGKIIVSTGDDIKHLFITSDGETWEEVETGGHTGIMIFEDRILYGPDHRPGLIIYDKNTETYRVVYERFGDSLRMARIDNLLYDDKTSIIYAGIIAPPGDNYGIICSSDRGETWNTFYHGGKAEGQTYKETFFVFLSIFRRQLYVSMGYRYTGKIYRAPLLISPVASFTYTPTESVVGEPVTFDASESYDPDGYITSWNWYFGDTTTGSGEIVEHVYGTAGTYEVTLTVTDNDGLNHTAPAVDLDVNIIPEFPTWALMLLALVVLIAALAIYKRARTPRLGEDLNQPERCFMF